MTQSERLVYLIKELSKEHLNLADMAIPPSEERQVMLLRSLMNVRSPKAIAPDILAVQDDYLKERLAGLHVTCLDELTPLDGDLYLWRGDITTLKCDGIVNAANSGMLGCFAPCHGCIDNAIHTYAGMQLRLECAEIMKKQGHEEETGQAKITKGYNLPARFVLHTVGPIVWGKLTDEHKKLLASCYLSCLKLAEENNLSSIAFCCISTGEFHFPNEDAAKIAVSTVRGYKEQTDSKIKVVFNVFKECDYEIYKRLLR